MPLDQNSNTHSNIDVTTIAIVIPNSDSAQAVGIWHAHGNEGIDSPSGHVDEIRSSTDRNTDVGKIDWYHGSEVIWTSYEGDVIKQWWDPTMNHGRGGAPPYSTICRGCVLPP